MNIGFFADDMSASHAALLANNALNRDDPGPPGILAGSNALAEAVPDYLDAARMEGRHLMVALPLAQLDNPRIRSRVDLAVVTYGPSVVARDGALRAMASEASRAAPLAPPAWLLSGTCRSRPDMPRTLPIRLTTIRSDQAADLRDGCTCGTLHRRAIGLAAALRIAAEDPCAPRIDPSDVADILTATGTTTPLAAAEARLREELLDLAADLDRGPRMRPGPIGDRRVPGAGRRTGRRIPPKAVGGSGKRTLHPASAVRHAAGCPCVAIA